MGHGSRVPGAADGMERVAEELRKEGRFDIVETCYMSRLGPHYPQILADCVQKGAGVVLLLPYFLHLGLHTRLDIPTMMKEEAKRHPGVKIIFGKNLGYDDALVDIVKKRIESSWGLDDVRDITLEARDKYPLPPGNKEFVEMEPEEAKKYRCGHRDGGHHDHGEH
ncbi:MAG: CbiX/SirB N-terminal domain-containing protein [Nitrospinae bacterium]|nr:CbiX/SirB N-terminal domain-containing protein [Nitrospinota bacterium]